MSEQPHDDQKQQNEDSKSYSIKFDYYDETDADAKAVSELLQQVTTHESMYVEQNASAETEATAPTKGEEKQIAQQIELNTIKAVKAANAPKPNAPKPNPNMEQMPSMQQILGELKLNLRGQYLNLEVDGETVLCKINDILENVDPNIDKPASRLNSLSVSTNQPITTTGTALTKREKRKGKMDLLVKNSTNRWLYVNDIEPDGEENCCDACNRCSNGCVNKFIAITVILIQIVSYITITWFLMDSISQEKKNRSKSCYGPNCDDWSMFGGGDVCIEITTGALISVLLVGFLWADVINALGTCKYGLLASSFCLLELFTAMLCGFLTAIYTPNSFDAISGAIGILFVHDLDERVFASMAIISRRKRTALLKKLSAVILWIVLSFTISYAVACRYNSDSVISDGSCLTTEYKCNSGAACIWKGFVCNGIEDCDDGSDEGDICDYAGFLAAAKSGVDYPADTFMCLSTGTFLKTGKRCDGKLDCVDGSDEGRASNCSEFVFKKKCGEGLTVTVADDEWHATWSGQFKCNNGQCIDAQYACDGMANDCVDGSDEYPAFDQSVNHPLFLSRCPYSRLRHCASTEALCKINGACINKNKLCDGIADCADGQDEEGCEYVCAIEEIVGQQVFQCGGRIAQINDTHIVTFGEYKNRTATVYLDTAQNSELSLTYLVGLITAADTGECIPYEWRCDGLRDCEDGSDEELCLLFTCDAITEFQCITSGICIYQESLCDYIEDCADGSDEVEKNCETYGRAFNASGSSVCKDLGYCFSDPCDYELCPGESTRCFWVEYACDGVCDCEYCEDEGATFGCSGTAFSPAPNYNQMTTATSVTVSDLGVVYCSGIQGRGNINAGFRDSYTFDIPGGVTNVNFTTCSADTMQLDSMLYLYDAGNTLIVSNDDDSSCEHNTVASTIVFNYNFAQFIEGNTFTIEVGGYGDQSYGVYALEVSCL